jgi:hypothetical protein
MAFARKWQRWLPALRERQIPEPAIRVLVDYDWDRARRGQMPLSAEETAAGLAAALGHVPTPEPERPVGDILGNVVGDVRQVAAGLLQAVPRPGHPGILGEIAAFRQAPRAVGEALRRGDVAALAEAPGVRLLPGSFLVSALARGGPSELARHPVLTLLDVLPFAHGAARALVGPEEAARLSPIRAAWRRFAQPQVDSMFRTVTGRFLGRELTPLDIRTRMGFGRQREVMRLISTELRRVELAQEPWVAELRRQGAELGLSWEDMERVSTIAERGNPEELARLAPNERRWLEEVVRPRVQELGAAWTTAGMLVEHEGELWPATRGTQVMRSVSEKLARVDERIARRAEQLRELRAAKEAIWGRPDLPGLRSVGEAVEGYSLDAVMDRARDVIALAGRLEDRHPWLTWTPEHEAPGMAAKEFRAAPTKTIERLRLRWAYALLDWRQAVEDLIRAIHTSESSLGVPVRTFRRVEARTARLQSLTGRLRDALARSKRWRAQMERMTLPGSPVPESEWVLTALDMLRGSYLPEEQLARVGLHRHWNLGSLHTILSERTIPIRRALADWDRLTARERKLVARLASMAAKRDELATRLEAAVAGQVPARWMPVVQERFRTEVLRRLGESPEEIVKREAGRPMDLDEAVRYVQEGYERWGVRASALADIWRDVAPMWRELRAAGWNPVWMAHVDETQVRSIARPYLFPERIVKPTEVRERTRDARPWIRNYEVALSYAHMELLRHRAAENVVATLIQRYGQRVGDYERANAAVARTIAERSGTTVAEAMARLMAADDLVRWEPRTVLPWRKPLPNVMMRTEYVMPRWVVQLMEQLVPSVSNLRLAFDRAMNAWRTSILSLAPRFHVNNVIGGALATSMEVGPTALFRYARAAYRMVREHSLPIEVTRGVGSVVSAEDFAWHYKLGRTIGRWLQQAGQRPPARGLRRVAEVVARPGASVIDWSLRLNAVVDEFYRAIAFLARQDDAIAKGLSPSEARLAAVETANRILTDWDDLVPFERNVLRGLFPFYAWMRHIVRFALGLPIDHPLRVSVLANFARYELEDMPERFWNQVLLGPPDFWGRVKVIGGRGMNPFADVANYATLAGVLGQLNPVLGAALEASGISAVTGTPELFPDVDYDPVSQRLVARRPGVLRTMLFGVLPPAEIPALFFEGLQTPEERAERVLNPDVWASKWRSRAGLPFIPRTVNVRREAVVAELARRDAARAALRRALRTADWTTATPWPSNRPVVELLRKLDLTPWEITPRQDLVPT